MSLIDIYDSDYGLEDKIGQMLIFGFRGLSPTDEWVQSIQQHLESGKIGGALILDYNIQSPKQTKDLMSFFHSCNAKIKPLFAIDQEGGAVSRLSKQKGFNDFPSAQDMADTYTVEQAYEIYSKLVYECVDYGFNYLLAPVVDINVEPDSPVISAIGRTYSVNPIVIYAYAGEFNRAIHDAGMVSCLKHFPGHGSACGDTHKDITDVTDSWQDYELDPYAEFIEKEQVDSIMSSHILHRDIDCVYPASLSTSHVQEMLREQMCYDGVVITDDLQMCAIWKYYTLEEIVLNAIKAGNDLLVFSQYFAPDISLVDKVTEIIRAAIADKKISEQRIDESFKRIIKLKNSINCPAFHKEDKS